MLGWIPYNNALYYLLFLVLLTGLGDIIKPLHPSPGSVPLRLTAFYAAIMIASWSHMMILLAKTTDRRGIDTVSPVKDMLRKL